MFVLGEQCGKALKSEDEQDSQTTSSFRRSAIVNSLYILHQKVFSETLYTYTCKYKLGPVGWTSYFP